MKKLALLLSLLSVPAFAQTSLLGTGLRVIPQASAPPACTLGRLCLWYDSGAVAWKFRNADGTDTVPSAGALPSQGGNSGKFLTTNGSAASWSLVDRTTATSTHGLFNLQGQINGVDANNNNFFVYDPTEAGATNWNQWVGSFNSGGSKKDQVMRMGWNVASGGGLSTAGVIGSIGALSDEWESYFEGTSHQMERHIAYIDPLGTVHRAWSSLHDLSAPYYTTLMLTAETGLINPTALTVGMSWTTSAVSLNSNAQTQRVYVDDSQVWLKKGSNQVLVNDSGVSTVGALFPGADNTYTLGDGGPGNRWSYLWATNYWAVGDAATGGATLKDSGYLRLDGHYWSGSNTELRADIVLELLSTAPTSRYNFKIANAAKLLITNTSMLQVDAAGGLDTFTSGTMSIGGTNATTITVGRSGQGVTFAGNGLLFSANGTGLTSSATTGKIFTDDVTGTKINYGNTSITQTSTLATYNTGVADGATAIGHQIITQNALTTSGAAVAEFHSSANTETYISTFSGDAGHSCAVAVSVLADTGGITAGKVIVWSGNTGKATDAGATNNLSTVAGVALTTASSTNSARVCKIGKAKVNADAGIVAGDLLVTSNAAAGNVKTNNAAAAGTIVGKAIEATGTTTAGKVYVDVGNK